MSELKSAYQIALEKMEAREPIPKITDPMGARWDQPDRSEILVDDKYAVMTRGTLEKLAEYSCSVPSGVYHGKMWRRASEYVQNPTFWWLMWYGPHPDPDKVSVNARKILVID